MIQNTQAVSPLRQRMIEDMMLRKLSPKTQSAYIRAVKELLSNLVFRQINQAATCSFDVTSTPSWLFLLIPRYALIWLNAHGTTCKEDFTGCLPAH